MKHRILATLSICTLIFASSCESGNNNDNPYPDIINPDDDDNLNNDDNQNQDNKDDTDSDSDDTGGDNVGDDNPDQDIDGNEDDNPDQDIDETPEEDNRFVFWGSQETRVLYTKIFDEFKSIFPEYSNLDFTYYDSSYSIPTDYLLNNDEAPDVYLVYNDSITLSAITNVADKVQDKYINNVLSNNTEMSIEACSYNDELYAYPLYLNNGYIFFYDKSVITDYDENTTFDEVIAQCAKANKKFAYAMGDPWYLYGAFAGFGGNIKAIYDNAGKEVGLECNFDDEYVATNTGSFLVNLANNEHYKYTDGGASGDPSVVLNNYIPNHMDEVGAFIAYHQFFNAFDVDSDESDPSLPPWEQNNADNDFRGKENIGYGVLPIMVSDSGEKARMKTFVSGACAQVYAKSDKKDAAHAFANYISSKEVQLKTYQFNSDYFPTNLEAGNTSEVLSNELFVAFNRQCELGGSLQADIPSVYWSALQNAGVLIGYKKQINKDNFQASMEYIVKQMKKDTEIFYN